MRLAEGLGLAQTVKIILHVWPTGILQELLFEWAQGTFSGFLFQLDNGFQSIMVFRMLTAVFTRLLEDRAILPKPP